MHYYEFEDRIKRMAQAASADARRQFALQTIELLKPAAARAIEEELSPSECAGFRSVLANLETRPPNELAAELNSVNESMTADDVRAIEFDAYLIQLICAVDSLIHYRRDNDPARIAAIAINQVNCVGWHIEDEGGNSRIDDMLSSPPMAAEFERICSLLAPSGT